MALGLVKTGGFGVQGLAVWGLGQASQNEPFNVTAARVNSTWQQATGATRQRRGVYRGEEAAHLNEVPRSSLGLNYNVAG